MALLKVEKLSKQFEGLTALNGLELNVFSSEILGIIGPNGAGKTTFF
ncbi:MAG: ATP-binding cassette domain-containing protein, partial [Alphaproteobacteria bacterium]